MHLAFGQGTHFWSHDQMIAFSLTVEQKTVGKYGRYRDQQRLCSVGSRCQCLYGKVCLWAPGMVQNRDIIFERLVHKQLDKLVA